MPHCFVRRGGRHEKKGTIPQHESSKKSVRSGTKIDAAAFICASILFTSGCMKGAQHAQV